MFLIIIIVVDTIKLDFFFVAKVTVLIFCDELPLVFSKVTETSVPKKLFVV